MNRPKRERLLLVLEANRHRPLKTGVVAKEANLMPREAGLLLAELEREHTFKKIPRRNRAEPRSWQLTNRTEDSEENTGRGS